MSVFVLGIGNPAREDDGIGPAVIAAIEARRTAGTEEHTLEANYQLTVEDAATIAEHDAVVFVDAAVSGEEPYRFERIEPRREESFSTHSVLPHDVLGMAHEMFGSEATGYLLAVRGYSFRMFTEELTAGAKQNARAATEFLAGLLEQQDFARVAGGSA